MQSDFLKDFILHPFLFCEVWQMVTNENNIGQGPIGIFDSGLGGLVMTKAFRAALPEYDFLYLGDTLHVPYGPRSASAIFHFTQQAVKYLFDQGCPLVIIACNTASANALRRLQQEFLPDHFPYRRILGVIVPTIEATIDTGHTRIGLIATAFTVNSKTYEEELQKINPKIRLSAKSTPLLVPLAENDGLHYAKPILEDYLGPLLADGIDSLILGCTHYPLFRPTLEEILPPNVDIIAQNEVVPPKLANYLHRHPEIEARLSRGGTMRALLTDVTPSYNESGARLLGESVVFEKVILDD
jgi:glutamate racemase